MSIQMNRSDRPYGPYNVGLLDDLHTYYPAILYEPARFTSITSLLLYIQLQNRHHFDIFSRNQQTYTSSNPLVTPQRHPPPQGPPPVRRRPSSETPPRIQQPLPQIDTFDLTQLFTTPFPTQLEEQLFYPQTPAHQLRNSIYSTSLLTEILQMLQPSQRTAGATLEPVLVYPSMDQIDASTSLRAAIEADEEDTYSCSICQEGYTEGQAIRTINHCHHSFHKTCIDPWFQRNVRCPVCRYDIREHRVSQTP